MQFLTHGEDGFERAFERVVRDRRESDTNVTRDVGRILNEVRERGDDALVEYTMRFDEHRLTDDSDWRITAEECAAAYAALDPDLRDALQLAADRIRAYHEGQLPQTATIPTISGCGSARAGTRSRRQGFTCPEAARPIPSSLLMNAIPAKVAGVERLVVDDADTQGREQSAGPCRGAYRGRRRDLARRRRAGRGAMAYGTDRIAKVDVIAGPGNAWVAEAKRQLYGVVGIDMVAGPSEILVIADKDNDPDWIAADLLSQAEHDPTSQSILITDDKLRETGRRMRSTCN